MSAARCRNLAVAAAPLSPQPPSPVFLNPSPPSPQTHPHNTLTLTSSPHLTSHPQTLFSANLTGSSAFTRTETKSRSRRVGAATCPWRLIEMKGKVLCGVCVDEMGGPLSCQSAFCGLLRDEESEHYRVTSVATAASGRGCLGYLAAPAALTVRNCLIKQSEAPSGIWRRRTRNGDRGGGLVPN